MIETIEHGDVTFAIKNGDLIRFVDLYIYIPSIFLNTVAIQTTAKWPNVHYSHLDMMPARRAEADHKIFLPPSNYPEKMLKGPEMLELNMLFPMFFTVWRVFSMFFQCFSNVSSIFRVQLEGPTAHNGFSSRNLHPKSCPFGGSVQQGPRLRGCWIGS